jgi:hypothetical protein
VEQPRARRQRLCANRPRAGPGRYGAPCPNAGLAAVRRGRPYGGAGLDDRRNACTNTSKSPATCNQRAGGAARPATNTWSAAGRARPRSRTVPPLPIRRARGYYDALRG